MIDLVAVRPPRTAATTPYSVMLICSSGGHLSQLLRLRSWWGEHDRVWISFDKPDVRSQLDGEHVVMGHHPTTRNLPNLVRNFFLAVRELRERRPDVIISNGAGLAVPFFWLAWLMRIPTVYVEVYDRIDSATLTGRLVRPVTSRFCVQWPEQQVMYPDAEVIGPVW